MNTVNDYTLYRGKCRETSEQLVRENPELRLVRGYYCCPTWGKQAHWWCEKQDGTIVDPTKNQFPSKGTGAYIEFDGWTECAECGKRIHEDDAIPAGNYAVCSSYCYSKLVGVI